MKGWWGHDVGMDVPFRILDVFTVDDEPFTGNPLGVFLPSSPLPIAVMQALGRQLNLSEITFLTGLADGASDVRIFTPAIEMGFAGHPTLGSAFVVGELLGVDDVVLHERVGDISVREVAPGTWELQASAGRVTPSPSSREDVAAALGVSLSALTEEPLVVDTGSEGLVVAVDSVATLVGCRPVANLLTAVAQTSEREPRTYVVTPVDGGFRARMFYVENGSVKEDPATGSQCANLGGWLAHHGHRGAWDVWQGEETGRPSRLGLRVDDGVFVAGHVRQVASGTWAL